MVLLNGLAVIHGASAWGKWLNGISAVPVT